MTEGGRSAPPAARPPRATRRSTRRGWSRPGTPTGSWPAAREIGSERWIAYLEPLPDRLRDDDPTALRATATRSRAAYGVKDSIRDVLPADADRAVPRLDRPADPRAQPGAGLSPSSSGLNASSRNGEGTAGS